MFAAEVENAAAFAEQIQFALHDSQQPSARFKQHLEHARRAFSMEVDLFAVRTDL